MRKLSQIGLVFVCLVFACQGLFALPPHRAVKNVLLINSYHQGYHWTDSLTLGILQSVRYFPEISLYVENLDSKKFGQAKFETDKKYFQEKYAGIHFQGVLVNDNDALDFAFKYYNELFPGVPVVYTGVSNPEDYPLENSPFYGIKQSSGTEAMLDLVSSLMPEAKNMLVIADITTTGQIYREEFRKMQGLHPEIKIIYPDSIDAECIIEQCRKSVGVDLIYYIAVTQDQLGRVVDNFLLLESIVKIAPVPVFSNVPAFLGKGVVGGPFQRGTKIGAEAVHLLSQLMKHPASPSVKRVSMMDQEYFFDHRELDRFNISSENLPAGSLIINENHLFTKSNFTFLLVSLGLLILIVVVLSVVNRIRRVQQRKSLEQMDKIEFQTKELQDAHEKLTEAIDELEKANQKLYASNIELREAKKKAEESDRLKSAFLANVSHEIRTPLNSIVGFSSLLCEKNLDDKTREMYSGLVESNTESLLVLIDEIIDLSKIESQQLALKKQDFSVNSLFLELYQMFTHSHKGGSVKLKMKVSPGGSELFLFSDRVRVRQIFINLLSNAFKFTDTGFIEMGFSLTEEQQVVLYVKDTGIGIRKEDHQAIFQRFRKLNENSGRVYRGTGLGLAITQKLVELLGGNIWIESELGKGATFFFTLSGCTLRNEVRL